MAALTAARAGKRVILADEQSEMGGSLLCSTQSVGGMPAADWAAQAVAELSEMDNVLLLPRSTATGYHDHNFVTVAERRTEHLADQAPKGQVRGRMHRVRAGQVMLCTGAHERPLVFANNDLPGVMMASAVSTYINRYAVRPGQVLALCTSNDCCIKRRSTVPVRR